MALGEAQDNATDYCQEKKMQALLSTISVRLFVSCHGSNVSSYQIHILLNCSGQVVNEVLKKRPDKPLPLMAQFLAKQCSKQELDEVH